MRSSFTDAEIADYRESGFLSVHDFLSAAELDHWRQVVDAAMDDDRAPGTSRTEVFTQRMQLRTMHADVKQLIEDPQIGRLVAELEGIDAVRIYLDQALAKEPYGTTTQYHLDLPWWPFDSAHACTIWVALDESTLENGCLYFVAGSHHLGLTTPGDLGPDLGALFAAHPEAAIPPTPCPLPAGGCSFHNGRTVHGAGANMTPGRRRAMTAAFMPDGVRFNGTVDVRVLGEAYVATLVEGDALANDELNPVTYARA
jgi:phytanoyl-CoA hydroxylase